MATGKHWPREQQVANGRLLDNAGPGNPAAAALVHAAWAALLPPFEDVGAYDPDDDTLWRAHG